jgi:hypothetical protein
MSNKEHELELCDEEYELSEEEEYELTEEELELEELERIKAEKLNQAIMDMINRRFGGNIAGKNAIKSIPKKTNYGIIEKNILDENNFNHTKNDVKVPAFRKQREFGARKRIKP